MCRKVTAAGRVAFALAFATLLGAQTRAQLDWRHIGNAAIDLALPSVGTGPVDRVWYSPDGTTLYAWTRSGHVFSTADLEQWKTVADITTTPPSDASVILTSPPEPGARERAMGSRVYGFAKNAFRSDDGGVSWANLTSYKGSSILGAPITDLAISPRESNDIVAANALGLWHSTDGGLSWTGLNNSLPNLPIRKIYTLPSGSRGLRISLAVDGAELEWAPGEKSAWRVTDSSEIASDARAKEAFSRFLNANITAIANSASGDTFYAGSSDGRIWTLQDQAWSLPWHFEESGPVEAIFVDPKDSRTAYAVFGAHPKPLSSGVPATHLAKTMNGGIFWDNSTTSLPDVAAHGVTADHTTGAVYVATDSGVFFTSGIDKAGWNRRWVALSGGLPEARAMDVKLDPGSNQLYAALEGYGVYVAMAPHRLRDIAVVNAADFSARAAAPGSLLSVLGTKVASAQAGDTTAPVLAADDTSSQIQVPFDAKGESLALSLQADTGAISALFPLRNVSPAIFVDPDGTPMILDAASGVMLDAANPARGGGKIQVLATGMGRVDPEWTTGMPGPATDPPNVVAQIHAYIDHVPVEVTRAVLAPYVGYYIIELQLPRIVNAGPAELYIEAEGQSSNPVRLYIEP
ncbi:MAG TPA: hypothetical protein VKU01_00940 [Bryobacteraceae bacterium]|nr:hypothetical protein [Bryobacteraceae bacterium]